MKKFAPLPAVLLVTLILTEIAEGQEGGFTQVVLGPFGTITAVKNEADRWTIPIRVYSDRDTEVYVPDITSAGWLSWNVESFRQSGTYLTKMFYRYKTSARCQSVGGSRAKKVCEEIGYETDFVTVDTHKRTLKIMLRLWM